MPRPKRYYEPVNAYVPVNLPDIDVLGLPNSNPKLNPDRIRAIYHLLYLYRGKNATNDTYNITDSFRDGWVNLSSKLLIKVATRSYIRYLNYMEASGLLEIRRDAITGQKKYGRSMFTIQYRIPQNLLHNGSAIKHFKKQKLTDHCALKAIYHLRDSYRQIDSKRAFEPLPIHTELSAMLKEFEFDLGRAEDYLMKIRSGGIQLEDTNSGVERDYGSFLLNMDAFNEGYNRASKCDTFGERYHSPITNLWKPLRSFLVLSKQCDEKLVSLDITNSQPFFASFAVNPNIIKEVIPEFAPCIALIEPFASKPDFIEFAQLCAQGHLYEFWMNKRSITRAQAKQEIFYLMFSKNKVLKNGEGILAAPCAFSECFPSVSTCFRAVKSMTEQQLPFISNVFLNKYGQFAGKSSYHCALSCMMQRLESRIIRKAAQYMLDEGIRPFTTVHDSFILPHKYADKAKQIIESVFSQELVFIRR